MYVADMLSYLKKKKKRSCFRVTIFTHLCTWHFCDPLRRRRLRVSVNVSCQPVFSLFCRPHFIWNIHIVYKKCTLHLALLNFDPCINSFYCLFFFPFLFLIIAKFCSWWYPAFLCSLTVLVSHFTRLYLSNELKTD